MEWRKGRRSDNVVDARGEGGGGGGMRFGGGKGLSLTAIVLIVGIGWLTGQDPLQILGQLTGQMEQAPSVSTQTRQAPPANDEQADFVRAVLGDTEDTWGQVFQENGLAYKNPKLILFRGRVNSACGGATSASGPFYCPADQQVYLDLDFFREMSHRFQAAGDFAQVDGAAVAELPGPVAELVATVVAGIGLHPGQQGVAAEHLSESRRCDICIVQSEQRRDLARVRQQRRRGHRRGLHRRPQRSAHLAAAIALLGIARQFAQEAVVETQGVQAAHAASAAWSTSGVRSGRRATRSSNTKQAPS